MVGGFADVHAGGGYFRTVPDDAFPRGVLSYRICGTFVPARPGCFAPGMGQLGLGRGGWRGWRRITIVGGKEIPVRRRRLWWEAGRRRECAGWGKPDGEKQVLRSAQDDTFFQQDTFPRDDTFLQQDTFLQRDPFSSRTPFCSRTPFSRRRPFCSKTPLPPARHREWSERSRRSDRGTTLAFHDAASSLLPLIRVFCIAVSRLAAGARTGRHGLLFRTARRAARIL